MKCILLMMCLALSLRATGQFKVVQGIIIEKDHRETLLAGAVIYNASLQEVARSDSTGEFQIRISQTGPNIIYAKSVGYSQLICLVEPATDPVVLEMQNPLIGGPDYERNYRKYYNKHKAELDSLQPLWRKYSVEADSILRAKKLRW